MIRKPRWLVLMLAALPLTACFGGKSLQPRDVKPAAEIEVDRAAVLERFSKAIRFRTVSYQDPAQFDREAFLGLRKHLEDSFPLVHKNLKREIVNDFSLLYTWQGSDPSLKPALIMAHMDVVPTRDPEGMDWSKPAFDGTIDEGYIWGRGTLDDKINVFASLEAAEKLLAQGYKPVRTIMFEFGHDEEVGGEHGAAAVAKLLQDRGVRLEFVMDEGMAVIEPGLVPGVKDWVAFVGVAEKGYVTFELTARAEGGHSSQPEPHTAIGQLALAIADIEDHPMPAHLREPAKDILRYVARDASFAYGFIYRNLWLFSPVLRGALSGSPQSNALIRTTTAVTVIKGGTKENVLPTEATALVNHRILPGDTVEDVERHVQKYAAKHDVTVSRDEAQATEPSPISPLDSPGMHALVKTIREIYPEAAVTPGLVLGGTDSHHFIGLTDCIYRFGPMRFRKDDFERVHGKDERIAIDDYLTAIRFYDRMLQNAGTPEAMPEN